MNPALQGIAMRSGKGLTAVPVIMMPMRSHLARRWHDLMHVNAVTMADGTATPGAVVREHFHLMLDAPSQAPTLRVTPA